MRGDASAEGELTNFDCLATPPIATIATTTGPLQLRVEKPNAIADILKRVAPLIARGAIPQILTRKFSTGMAMGFITKDLKIAVDTAHAIGAHAPLAEKTHALWAEAVEKFGGQLDQTEVVKLWEQVNGVIMA